MELRWTHFPYCVRRLKDGRYIVLNRNYKPLGEPTTDRVDYDAHPSAVAIKITAAAARKLSWEAKEDLESIFLYSDGCVPTSGAAHMAAYCKRLAVLMGIKVKTP